jgi:single-strand DNA-binding protein
MNEIQVTLAGNLTADPELRTTDTAVPFATFTVAVTPRVKQADGSYADGETTFQCCVAWRDLASNIADSLKRGDRVVVHGTLSSRRYANEDGESRTASEVTVDDIGPSLRWVTAKSAGPLGGCSPESMTARPSSGGHLTTVQKRRRALLETFIPPLDPTTRISQPLISSYSLLCSPLPYGILVMTLITCGSTVYESARVPLCG